MKLLANFQICIRVPLMSKLSWKSNFKHKMKIQQILQNLVYGKFYVREIAAVNLSKIYFVKNAKNLVKQTSAI